MIFNHIDFVLRTYRIFSTFDADIDDSRVDSGPFPQPLEFGEVYAEYTASCWVAAVAWSPTGQSVAFASKYRLLWHVRCCMVLHFIELGHLNSY